MPARSEYYLDLAQFHPPQMGRVQHDVALTKATESDIGALAELMVEAYRGTIDYHGEGVEDSIAEVRGYFAGHSGGYPLAQLSRLAFRNDRLIAACLCAHWDQRGQPVVAYVMTTASAKRQGLARFLLVSVLGLLQSAGHGGVHAVITDGNEASERLFRQAGFNRLAV